MAERPAGEVAGAGLVELDDIVAGAEGVDARAYVAVLVGGFTSELDHAVQALRVLEHCSVMESVLG